VNSLSVGNLSVYPGFTTEPLSQNAPSIHPFPEFSLRADYPNVGPDVPADSAYSARRLNERTLEITDKIKGKVTDTQQIELSPDFKTLTQTVHPADQGAANILVFERE
jgi:hypothetical protein